MQNLIKQVNRDEPCIKYLYIRFILLTQRTFTKSESIYLQIAFMLRRYFVGKIDKQLTFDCKLTPRYASQ